MSFDWDTFRELAEELRQRDGEAAQCTAISRIYYAIYWRARNLLQNEGFVFRQFDSSHRQVWEEYKNKGLTYRAISIAGSRLHQNRIQADYFAQIKDLKTLIPESFNLAENISNYLQQIEKKQVN